MPDKRGDTAAVGRAIYNENILPTLGPEYKGKVVVIDIHSGDYEVDADDATAMFRLLERRPDAFAWAERVGYPWVYRMGFRFTYPGFDADLNSLMAEIEKKFKHD